MDKKNFFDSKSVFRIIWSLIFGVFLTVVLSTKSTQKTNKVDAVEKNTSDKFAGWVISIYLVIQIVALSIVGIITWISSDWFTFLNAFPFLKSFFNLTINAISDDKFYMFQSIVLSSCAAGLGGAVYMVQSFYLIFAYGKKVGGKKKYLERKEIPRFVLLPFAAILLGPIGLSLLLAGSIAFVGFSGYGTIPHFSSVGLGFLLGFTYHDTLNKFRDLSRNIFSKNGKEKQES